MQTQINNELNWKSPIRQSIVNHFFLFLNNLIIEERRRRRRRMMRMKRKPRKKANEWKGYQKIHQSSFNWLLLLHLLWIPNWNDYFLLDNLTGKRQNYCKLLFIFIIIFIITITIIFIIIISITNNHQKRSKRMSKD